LVSHASSYAHIARCLTEVAVGLLVMMYPILCKVRYETLHRSFREKGLWTQVAFSVVVNWIIAPFFMVCAVPSPLGLD
jgi:ACR3 family arsenite efflux pump ArsB